MKSLFFAATLIFCSFFMCSLAFADAECIESYNGNSACGYHCVESYSGKVQCANSPYGACIKSYKGDVYCWTPPHWADEQAECVVSYNGNMDCGYDCKESYNGDVRCSKRPDGVCNVSYTGEITCL